MKVIISHIVFDSYWERIIQSDELGKTKPNPHIPATPGSTQMKSYNRAHPDEKK